MENTAKTISTLKKKGKSTNEASDEYISQEAPSQICQHDGVAVSYQPCNEIGGQKHIGVKNMRSDSAALTLVCASQMRDFSDDRSVHNCKERPKVSVLARNLLQTEVGNCSSNQISPCCNENRSKQGTEVVRNSCFTGNNRFSKLSELTSVIHCKVEDCNDCGSENNKMRQMNSQVCKVGTEDIGSESLIVQHDTVKAISHQTSNADGKENRTFICKRSHNNAMGAKRSNVDSIEKINNLPHKSEGLLSPPSVCAYEHTSTGCRDRKVGNKEPFMYTRIQNRAFVESSQWDDKRRLSQYGMRSNLSKHGNYSNRKEEEVCEPNFIGLFEHDLLQKVPIQFGSRHFKKSNYARTSMCNKQHAVSHGFTHLHPATVSFSHEQQNVLSSAKLNAKDCSLLSGFRTYDWKRIPRFKHAFERSSRSFSGSEPYSECHLCNFRQGSNTGPSEKKWTPVVAAKGSSMLKRTNSGGDSDDKEPITRKVENGSHLHASMAPLSKSPSVVSSESECHKMNSSISKPPNHELMVGSSTDSVKCGNKTNKAQQFVIGSPKAMEALNAAYKLQLESDSFQLAVQCPLAEVERFLHSASPVVSRSYTCGKCTVCSSKWLSHDPLCKHQIPNLSIRRIWEWYEEPGNYGLDVSSGFPESIPFHAYFAPSLSAIQLFYPRRCSHFDKNGVHVEPTCICCGSRGMDPSPACSTDSELVFEFFESEQPQDRKPLHLKVAELMNAGTSNGGFYGDPSKLECSNLRDLHPASWFSVAWYPIYRIPEGKLRASFLTYHSLGFLTQRWDHLKCCVVAPVLGLENYNAHDEWWFRPKLNYSVEALKERVRALEENASHFARGCCVAKDKANRQPDYEFFVCRKRPLTYCC